MKRILMAAAFTFLISSNAHATIFQWSGNGHYYEYTDLGYNPADGSLFWETAKADAESKGGYLATLTSAAEDNWVNATLGQSQYLHAWLGGYQPTGSPEPAGGWRWVTGETWDYTNWYLPNNEPNNYPYNDSNGESVLELGRFKNAPTFWNDMDPHQINNGFSSVPGYITEWNSNPVVSPEPASMILFGVGGVAMAFQRIRKKI